MARSTQWADKVLALAKGGNTDAAIAQIKVAPSVKDLKSLHAAMVAQQLMGRWPQLDVAVADHTDALSAPRLHRAP